MRRMLLVGAGIVLAASLTLAGSVSALAVGAQAGTDGWFTVSGSVTGASGPVHVWLYAWPSATVVRSLRPGQTVPLTVLGEQTTATGRYALSVNPGVLPGRIVNLEVAAFGGGAMTARSFTRSRVASAGSGTVLAMPFGPAQMAPQVANLRLRAAALTNPCGAVVFGSLVFKRNLGAKNTVVGATYSKASGVDTGFIYSRGQNSSLGVGLSGSSTYADFSESGTYGISSTQREPFPTYTGVASKYRVTQFRYGLFRWFCSGPHGGGSWANWQTQPTDFAGGTSAPNANPNFRTPYCEHFIQNSGIDLDNSSSFTFSGGVSIKDAISVNLSAQTGYDEGAEVSYFVTARAGRWICGRNNNPGGTNPPPRLIVAH